MKKILIYDLPTRIFHWLFAGLFVSVFLITKLFDDESQVYPYHMLLGFILSAAVIMRIFWGIFGSTYAKFSSFNLSPTKLFNYLKMTFSSKSLKFIGHNPASSYAAVLMMISSLVLAFTGYQMTIKNNKDFYEEIHESFSYIFLFVAILHVAGIVLHTIKHKDPIGLSMLNGKKTVNKEQLGISNQYPFIAVIFFLLIFSFSFNLFRNYNGKNGTLNFLGISLVLGDGSENK